MIKFPSWWTFLASGFLAPKHPIDMGGKVLKGLDDPVLDSEAARKKWVEDNFGAGGGVVRGINFVISGTPLFTESTNFIDMTTMSVALTTLADSTIIALFTGTTNHTQSFSRYIDFKLQIDGADMPGKGANCHFRFETSLAYSRGSAVCMSLSNALTAAEHTVKVQWRVAVDTYGECPRDEGSRALFIAEII